MIAARIFGSRGWYGFRSNPLSLIGLALTLAIVLLAIFAPFVAPYPRHAGSFIDFKNASLGPSAAYWFGTDLAGRDILSRTIFAYRISFAIVLGVLVAAVPIGILVGLIAGYRGGWYESILMRVTDVFLSIPPLVLALAILGLLPPSLINAVLALILMWWPWYARLTYNLTRRFRREGYVVAAEVIGASRFHIMFREILPNCIPIVITKAALDLGYVILLGASLSFIGLGAPPPTPDLGTMVAEGASLLPDLWWMCFSAGGAIFLLVLGFNLLGDGLNEYIETGV